MAYVVVLERERIEDASRSRQYVGSYHTRKDAEAAERHALEERARGIDLLPGRVTVAELLDRWKQDRRTQGLSLKTLEEDEAKVTLHIRPHIGAIRLAKLRPAHLQDLYAQLSEKGKISGKGGLSPKTVRHIHGIINTALEYAVRVQLLTTNPARSARPPKLVRGQAKALQPEQVLKILELAAKRRLGDLTTLAYATGARRGELLALKWSDIDCAKGRAMIHSSLAEGRGNNVYEKPPKSGRVRVIKLSPLVLRALRSQHAAQAADKLAQGAAYQDQGYVFADPLGRPLRPSYVSSQFREIALAAGIETRLHEARHTAASWMIADGVDIRTVSDVLGHSAASTTLNIYGHLLVEAQTAAMQGIEDRLQRAKDTK